MADSSVGVVELDNCILDLVSPLELIIRSLFQSMVKDYELGDTMLLRKYPSVDRIKNVLVIFRSNV